MAAGKAFSFYRKLKNALGTFCAVTWHIKYFTELFLSTGQLYSNLFNLGKLAIIKYMNKFIETFLGVFDVAVVAYFKSNIDLYRENYRFALMHHPELECIF